MGDYSAPSQVLDPFAHGIASGHDGLFSAFLGQPPQPEKTSAYAKRNVSKYNMPESYIGKNDFLADTTTDFMISANWTWYTTRILPFQRKDDIHFQWEQLEANPHYMDVTPEQAASSIVTQRRTVRTAHMIRRGIGAEFEKGFVQTAFGRARFLASIAQIARSWQETANVEVIRALLNAHRHAQLYAQRHQVVSLKDLHDYLDQQDARFMKAQKDEFGLQTLNREIDAEMERHQGQANVWIFTRDVIDYVQTAPPAQIYNTLGGQEAVDRIHGRPSGMQAAGGTNGNVKNMPSPYTLGTNEVFLVKTFHVDGIGHEELMSRTVEKGTYNTMIDRTRKYSAYTSASRAIRVFSITRDDWVEIGLRDANANCVLWNNSVEGGDGDVIDPFVGGRLGGRTVTDTTGGGEHDFLRYGTGKDSTYPKQDVLYIGDLEPEYFSLENAFEAAETLLNKFKDRNAGFTRILNDNATTSPPSSASGGDDLDLTLIRSILGETNLFLMESTGSTSGAVTVVADYATAVKGVNKTVTDLLVLFRGGKGTYTAKSTRQGMQVQGAIGVDAQETTHRRFLTETLGSVVPVTHADQMQRIAQEAQVPWTERAHQIGDLVMECFRADPQSVPSLSSETRIKQWISSRCDSYNEQLAQRTPARSVQSVVNEDIIQVPIGQLPPSGYTYLNADEERKAKSPQKKFPDSLADFHYLDVFEKTGSSLGIGGRARRGDFAQIGNATDTRGYDGTTAPDVAFNTIKNDRIQVRFHNLDAKIKEIAKSHKSNDLKMLAILYLGSRFNRHTFDRFIANDVFLPVNFLLLRLHNTFRTRYGIKCADGGRTGATFYGHMDMEIEHGATRKTGLMHFTGYMQPVVQYPQNVYVVQDIFCARYLGGGGATFWESAQQYKDMQSDRRHRDIISVMIPITKKQLDPRIDVRGQFYVDYRLGTTSTNGRKEDPCYPGAARVAALMGWWDPIRKGRAANQVARAHNIDINYECSQGVQFHLNTKDDTWCDVIVNKGALGPNIQPGLLSVLRGEKKFLSVPAYLGTTSIFHK